MGDLWARSPDGRHTCLYVLVVRYIYDSSVQALDSRRARRTTRPSRRRPKSQHAVGSKFAFERPMGGSHLARQEYGQLMLVSYRPLALSFAGALLMMGMVSGDNRVGDEVIVFVFVPVL